MTELKTFPQLGEYTFGERYYKVREILNEDIEKYTKALSEKCISKILLESPNTLQRFEGKAKRVKDLRSK